MGRSEGNEMYKLKGQDAIHILTDDEIGRTTNNLQLIKFYKKKNKNSSAFSNLLNR